MHRDILIKQVSNTNYQGDCRGQKRLLRGTEKFPMSHEANDRGDPSPRCLAGTCGLATSNCEKKKKTFQILFCIIYKNK